MSFSKFSLLRLLTAPRVGDVTTGALGYTSGDAALDRIPQAVVYGFESALEARSLTELEERVALVRADLTGFAYEGAAMACTITDVVSGGDRLTHLLNRPALPHLFLAYIGVGFAMARLPRAMWKRIRLDVDAPPYHPALSWLVVDGYGFDLAYFNSTRFIRNHERPTPWPFLGDPSYFLRAVDQGIGRALWFTCGADVEKVAKSVASFAPDRRGDLWSGVGLASTVAGPMTTASAKRLREVATDGNHHRSVGIGAVFGAKARTSAGEIPEHTHPAVRQLTGLDVADARDLAEGTASSRFTGHGPQYENWRLAIAQRLPLPQTSVERQPAIPTADGHAP